jgi:hypothetical protein
MAGGVIVALLVTAGAGGWRVLEHRDDAVSMQPKSPERAPVSASTESASTPLLSTRNQPASRPATSPAYVIVGSIVDAETARQRLVEQNALRHLNGAPDLNPVVMLAGSPEEAAQTRQTLADMNRLRELNGLPGIEVIDRSAP